MRFAFALYRYFPYGGLQCDTMRIAQEAVHRGHEVHLFVHEWLASAPGDGITVCRLPASGWSNHAKMKSFGKNFLKALKADGPFDATLVFNRIPGGSFYFAADNCLAVDWRGKHSGPALLLPRYRSFLQQEAEVCCDPKCRIMYIVPQQKTDYQQIYHIPESRFLYLPPGMNPACRRPPDALEKRSRVREQLHLSEEEIMLIQVASNIRLKGGDRTIRSIASLPEEWRRRIKLFLVGNCSSGECRKLADSLGIINQVVFTGGRTDVPDLLLGADLMVHPARSESAGSVLIEGIAAGLPVIASGLCGFSCYVAEINPSLCLPEPFEQHTLDQTLRNTLEQLPELKKAACEYAVKADFYRRAEAAVDALEGK